MLSASQKKYVNTLKQKKFRDLNQCFVVEGIKIGEELLSSGFKTEIIYATSSWIKNNPNIKVQEVTAKELKSISSLKTPNEILAVVKYPQPKAIKPTSNLTIALDKIQDPGNFGAIIRTADWFGVKQIICSNDTVDCYNYKVIQATMGSFFRVRIQYCNLKNFFASQKNSKIYGALLNGENVLKKNLRQKNAILLMGNESNGISEELFPFIHEKITIPKFGKAESLNVAIATAILCAEFNK